MSQYKAELEFIGKSFFFKIYLLLSVCVGSSLFICEAHACLVPVEAVRVWDPLQLKLQVVVSHYVPLRTELRFSARQASALNSCSSPSERHEKQNKTSYV